MDTIIASPNIENLSLTDLIDLETLQLVQESFSSMAGVASLITDKNGIALTKGSGFSDFCAKYVRTTQRGRKRCEECNRSGAENTEKEGTPCVYRCHAGLMDFAVPILVSGHKIGCFIGGQVLTQQLDEDKIRQVAVGACLGVPQGKHTQGGGCERQGGGSLQHRECSF